MLGGDRNDYAGQHTLVIGGGGSLVNAENDPSSTGQKGKEYYSTQIEILKSRGIASAALEQLKQFQQVYVGFVRSMESIKPPLAVPVENREDGSTEWQAYALAWSSSYLTAEMLEAERLMTEINTLVDNALPPFYLEISGDEISDYNEEFYQFLIPSIEQETLT